jgi:Domain of unknown function (DUF389)
VVRTRGVRATPGVFSLKSLRLQSLQNNRHSARDPVVRSAVTTEDLSTPRFRRATMENSTKSSNAPGNIAFVTDETKESNQQMSGLEGPFIDSNKTVYEVRESVLAGVYRRGEAKSNPIRTRDIVKIFASDNNFIEVTPEQLERVKMMHEKMEDGTTFSFNYNCLLLVASVLAGLGLVSNSSATIIASMLVSPLMGPVVGLAYGSTIRDWKLVRKSLIVELISLFFCIFMGMLLASVTGLTSLSDSWPTPVRF